MNLLLLVLQAALALAVPSDLLLERAPCKADNCARAVTGTAVIPGKPNPTARREDCSSFMTTTVFTDGAGATVSARTALATVPSYASPCTTGSPQLAYASACSCWGVTPTIIAVPAPTPLRCDNWGTYYCSGDAKANGQRCFCLPVEHPGGEYSSMCGLLTRGGTPSCLADGTCAGEGQVCSYGGCYKDVGLENCQGESMW